MASFKTFISRFVRDDNGAAAVEYGLLVGLIALAVISTATAIGTDLRTVFGNVGTELVKGTAK